MGLKNILFKKKESPYLKIIKDEVKEMNDYDTILNCMASAKNLYAWFEEKGNNEEMDKWKEVCGLLSKRAVKVNPAVKYLSKRKLNYGTKK